MTPMNSQSFITSVRHQMNIFLGALMFLTRIPVGKQYVFRSEDLPRSTLYFPIIGLMIGLLGGLMLFFAEQFVPPIVAVLLGTAAIGIGIMGFGNGRVGSAICS